MIFRPTESSSRIVDFYRRYLLTTFSTNKDYYNEQLKQQLAEGKAISDGPYISMSDPYRKGKTIRDLVEKGVLSPSILSITGLKPDRPLYLHQENAIERAAAGKNLIITTGTGSGKTESFMIPIINELLSERDRGTLSPGVRTMIIYPMNALVNDQIRRLRELLGNMSGQQITYGRFTGETKENYTEARRKFIELEGEGTLPDNELISREQMRNTPPNILITNYAMLEYMLLRPGDNIIFSSDNSQMWKYIVFDEAHSYTGAKGIEVSALIRRVKAMLQRDDIRFILTSATLGDEKSNSEIVRFGESLCSAPFNADSIIRSETEQAQPEREIVENSTTLYTALAKCIKENDPEDVIKKTLSGAGVTVPESQTIQEALYDVILHDNFYYRVRSVLYGQILSVSEAASRLNISKTQFTDFIAVASNAIKNDQRLFEAKYHMFLRGIEGVYVTLPPSNKLFTRKMQTYIEDKDDPEGSTFQVYEVSFCSNCNALYITGDTQTNPGYLTQKPKYSEGYEPEVFLLSGDYDEEESDDADSENVFQICSKCGAIKHATSVTGLQCGHGSEYISKLIRVKGPHETLHQCPCCHSRNAQRSIMRPFFLGNEAATAVIATALYDELPSEEVHKEVQIYHDEFFGGGDIETVETRTEPLVRQFLAFSDSRQNAAFFASYLGITYQDALIKRLLFEVAHENKSEFEEGISLPQFVTLLANKFRAVNAFPYESEDRLSIIAWTRILREMSNYKAKNSMLTNGILKFELNFDVPALPQINLSSDEVRDMIRILCMSFMREAGVYLSNIDSFTKEDRQRFTSAGFQKGFRLNSIGKSYIIGWSPEERRTNRRLKYLTKITGDEAIARRLLDSIWNLMISKGIIVDAKIKNEQAYYLNPNNIQVKAINTLYICEECRNVLPYNVKGICDNPNCKGHIRIYNYKEELRNNHYYNLYTRLGMVPMVVREHTAQLSNEHAYDYQRDFKKGAINVLSCSTTFEMGVDVGSLETVFMRNMPPSPANYAQRAGRAGRSIHSAAYALTYCPNSSHDLNYFRNPLEMIRGTIKPPFFNVANDKIVLRHIFASAFSFFWKAYPNLYIEKIGEFIDAAGFDTFIEYLNRKPDDLKQYLLRIVPSELQTVFGINQFGWLKKLNSENENEPGLLNIAVRKYQQDLSELNKAYNEKVANHERGIDRIQASIATLRGQRIIEYLSRNNLIPKYGFPVDTVDLQTASSQNYYNSGNLKLSRDLFTAISEYAPESEVVADGSLYTSRYIRKLTGYAWPQYNYSVCPTCRTLNRALYVDGIRRCRQCGEMLPTKRQYIIPKFGFIMDTAGPKDVGTNKPEKTFKGAISYIGDESRIEFHEYHINGHQVILGNSKMDSLAVLNESPFYICETCGYGKLTNQYEGRRIEYGHKDPSGRTCPNSMLTSFSIGHDFQTDVVLIKFADCDTANPDVAWTILYSLLEGLSKVMAIDRNELSGCLQWYQDVGASSGKFAFVLFDNTPGGAGYVRQLEDPTIVAEMMRESFRVVSGCTCGGETADTVCYSCLCNYYNQRQHEVMKRKYAIDFFNHFITSESERWIVERNPDAYSTGPVDNSVSSSTDDRDIYHIQLSGDGQNQSSETLVDIWKNIQEDCEEGPEREIFDEIIIRGRGDLSKPLYKESIVIIESGTRYETDLLWPDKKVILFLGENRDVYIVAKNTDWKCYCTEERFDIDSFLKDIGE